MPKVKQKCVADGNRVNIREPFLSDLGLELFGLTGLVRAFRVSTGKSLKTLGRT